MAPEEDAAEEPVGPEDAADADDGPDEEDEEKEEEEEAEEADGKFMSIMSANGSRPPKNMRKMLSAKPIDTCACGNA